MYEPLVSIIIPTKNSKKWIEKCLKSIKGQTYPNIEIIVVDAHSKDGTTEIAERYGAKVIMVNSERTKAKNIGAGEAKGDYLFFIDSDMGLTSRVVEEGVGVLKSTEGIGGVIVPERSVGKGYWSRVRDFERRFYVGTEVESARFFKRDLFEKVNGFDENIVFFEEATLPQKIEKLGYNVRVRITSYILHYEVDFSLQRWLKKKFYYGKTAKTYKEKYEDSGKKQLSLFYRYRIFLRYWHRFFDEPLLGIGVLILKHLEFLSAGLGYLIDICACNRY